MVTILLATLNGEDYLKAQLESIAAQTYENWQLVVGDDGSTDGTISILTDRILCFVIRMMCGNQIRFI